jgi:tRNA threonylcarbamoyladenosine biosynthesis protein TsaE
LGELLGQRAFAGLVVTLDGDLGAGKTTLTKAVAVGLGIRRTITSPTYTIVREYDEGRLPLYHMDIYRVGGGDLEELGLEDYFYGDGVSVVEWASLIDPRDLPAERLEVVLKKDLSLCEDYRVAELTPNGAAAEELCQNLVAEFAH